MIIEFSRAGNMNYNSVDYQQESSKSGYTPNVQVTTGMYCVTMYSSQSSGKPFSNDLFSKKDYPSEY